MKRKRRRDVSYHLSSGYAKEFGIHIPAEPTQRYLSPNDIGKLLNLTGEAVKQWIYHRRLPAVKLSNGYWKVKASDLEKFLKSRNDLGKRTVLLAANHIESREVLDSTVQSMGHNIIISTSSADALLKACSHLPALIIINCSSSDPDPWKFAEKIRNTKSLRTTPILLVGQHELSDTEAAIAIELSAVGFLKMPLDPKILKQELEMALN